VTSGSAALNQRIMSSLARAAADGSLFPEDRLTVREIAARESCQPLQGGLSRLAAYSTLSTAASLIRSTSNRLHWLDLGLRPWPKSLCPGEKLPD
jgi:hypothetical protein